MKLATKKNGILTLGIDDKEGFILRIGYLEDEYSQSELVKSWLMGEGFAVTHASTGRGFISLLADNPVDLLILDWHLPDMEGIEVLGSVRDQLNSDVPVVFATQRDAEADHVLSREGSGPGAGQLGLVLRRWPRPEVDGRYVLEVQKGFGSMALRESAGTRL